MCKLAKRVQRLFSGCRLPMGMVLALLAALLTLTTGGAEACSKHVTSGNSAHWASIAHNARHLAQVTPPATVLKAPTTVPGTSGAPCCGGGCHCCGPGCVNGCCVGGLAAIDVAGSNLVSMEGAEAYGLPTQGSPASLKPPPDFRPPPFFA